MQLTNLTFLLLLTAGLVQGFHKPRPPLAPGLQPTAGRLNLRSPPNLAERGGAEAAEGK